MSQPEQEAAALSEERQIEVQPDLREDSAPSPDEQSAQDRQALTPPPDDDVLRFKRSHFYLALLPVTFVVGLASGYLFWGRGSDPTTPPTEIAAADSGPESRTRLNVSVDDDPALGPIDAPITIIEFSDFNCPFCRKWHQETFSTLLDTYPDQIRFIYRDFPIVGGGQIGLGAAQAANCAAEQDAYWEFHDALFSGKYELNIEGYRQYAAEIGLDPDEIQSCVESGRYAEEVQNDLRYGADLGVSGTPTFFINGIPLVGAQPMLQFTAIIDDELGR